jgi:hypothetical protein
MKVICIFLSMLIVSLSALPCCYEVDNCNEEIELCEKEANHSSQNEESNPPCSPFFSCGSCTGFSFSSINFSKTDTPLVEHNKLMDLSGYGITKAFKTTLLKPPRQI